jgi:hypothetical protein
MEPQLQATWLHAASADRLNTLQSGPTSSETMTTASWPFGPQGGWDGCTSQPGTAELRARAPTTEALVLGDRLDREQADSSNANVRSGRARGTAASGSASPSASQEALSQRRV